MTPSIDEMENTLITRFQSIFKNIAKNYGNPLHIAVYIRDIKLFNHYKTHEYLQERFNGYKPMELAAKLGYNEFLNGEFLKIDPVTGEIVIKQSMLRKYINPFRGYRNRVVKLTKNYLMTCSDKITVYELDDAFVIKDGNIITLKSNAKNVRLKCEENVDEWYELLINKQKRFMLSRDDHREKSKMNEPNPCIYIFLIKVLIDKSGDEELKKLVMGIEPFNNYFSAVENSAAAENVVESELESVSIETDYDSCNEEFYDIESR